MPMMTATSSIPMLRLRRVVLFAVVVVPAVALIVYPFLRPIYYQRQIRVNFEKNQTALEAIEAFARKKYPINLSIEEFPKVDVVTWIPHPTGKTYLNLRSIDIGERKLLDSLALVDWKREDLAELTRLLQCADCVGIRYYAPKIPEAGQPLMVNFRATQLYGVWAYFIFPESLSVEQMQQRPADFDRLTYLAPRIGWTRYF